MNSKLFLYIKYIKVMKNYTFHSYIYMTEFVESYINFLIFSVFLCFAQIRDEEISIFVNFLFRK